MDRRGPPTYSPPPKTKGVFEAGIKVTDMRRAFRRILYWETLRVFRKAKRMMIRRRYEAMGKAPHHSVPFDPRK